METSLKTCFKCGETKPRTEFYKHPMMADGLLGKCKSCTKRDSTTRRWSKVEEVRDYDRNRGHLEHRKSLNMQRLKRVRRTKKGKAQMRAYNIVYRAIAKGTLVRRPCEICGDTKTHAHHHDYNLPLDVRWLCTAHHQQAHAGRIIA